MRRILRSTALLLVLGGCAACEHGGTVGVARPEPTHPVSSSSGASASAAATPEGQWRVGPLPMSVILANLHTHHLDQWSRPFLGARTRSTMVQYDLKLRAGQLTLLATMDGKSQGVEDRQAYTVTRNQIAFAPLNSTCTSRFAWATSGERLRLTFLSDTCRPYKGTPDEVFMRSLYASAPFVRTDS